jgi:quercetin dioxygenase-like cupin family protein
MFAGRERNHRQVDRSIRETTMRFILIALSFTLIANEASAQVTAPTGTELSAVKWGPAPSALPKGGEMAGLSGDPGRSGPFTVRLKMPAGYKIAPHQHPHSERVTVISGELRFGGGEKLDEPNARKLGPGGFVELPPNTYHYAFATVDTVIQISAEGPFGIKYANPADDPSKGQ